MSLKSKAAKSFSWTFFEMIFSQGTILITGIILARILSPEEFGIIGIISAFLAVSNSIIEGGFGRALLRKLDAVDIDYSTVFIFNFIFGVILYIVLLLTSKYLETFFKIPGLGTVLNYSGAVLIINSLTIIQQTIFTKELNFKLLAIISVIASLTSGLIAIYMAFKGYGIWSLVTLIISKPLINTILLWYFSKWKLRLQFSKESFVELFDYGYKVLLSGLINTLYKNIYYILIGKFFSPASLGYYTRSEQFQSPVAGNITRAIGKISFPILSTLQNDKLKLKLGFIKFLKFSIFINFTIMLSLAGMAKPIIILLVGAKWETSIYYLQLLCISGMLYPLQLIHINLLLIKGYSNLQLRLEIIKKIILIPIIFVTAYFSIEVMLYGLIVFSFIEYFINSFYTRKIIDYSYLEQFNDILPYLITSIVTFLVIISISLINMSLLLIFLTQIAVGLIVFISINEILKQEIYLEAKSKVLQLLKR